jgi:hypothetical protein
MGQEFNPSEFKLYFLGKFVTKIKMVSVTGDDNSEYLPTMAKVSDTLGVGQEKTTGSIEMYQSEYEALADLVPAGKNVLALDPFDIVMTYVPTNGRGRIITRRVIGVKIKSFEESVTAGTTHQTMKLTFIAQTVAKA